MKCNFRSGIPRFSAFNGGCRHQFGSASLFRRVFCQVLGATTRGGLVDTRRIFMSSARMGTDTGGHGFRGGIIQGRAHTCRRHLRRRVGRSHRSRKGGPFPPSGFSGRRCGRVGRDAASPRDNCCMGSRHAGRFTCSFRTTTSHGNFILNTVMAPNGARSDRVLRPLMRRIVRGIDGPGTITTSTTCGAPTVADCLLGGSVAPTLPCAQPHAGRNFFEGRRCICSRRFSYCVYPANRVLGCAAAAGRKCHRCGSSPQVYTKYPFLSRYARDRTRRGLVRHRI